MDIGDAVRVKANGHKGVVTIMEGIPIRIVYVELHIGADAGYVYLTLGDPSETLTLNPYNIDDLEIV